MKTAIEKLTELVESKPGFDSANYFAPGPKSMDQWKSERQAYNSDRKMAIDGKKAFFDILSAFILEVGTEKAEREIDEALQNTGGRIHYSDDQKKVVYDAGQYYCTEYRLQAASFLSDLFWNSLPGETGDEKRKQARKRLRTGAAKRFFR